MMTTVMREKVALITGGSKDTGADLVRKFVRLGTKVAIVDVDMDAAQTLASEIDPSNSSVLAIRCDVAKQTDVQSAFAKTLERFGRLDYLINLAGPYRPRDPLEQWEFMVSTNLLGTLYATRAAVDAMKKHGGSVVNVASDSGLGFGPEQQPAYGAAKAGVMRFTAALQFLAKDHGIRVNCVVPDWIGTHAVMSWISQLSPTECAANHVPTHMITTSEFADLIIDVATRKDLAGRVILSWSGKPPEVIEYGDRGYQSVEHLLPSV